MPEFVMLRVSDTQNTQRDREDSTAGFKVAETRDTPDRINLLGEILLTAKYAGLKPAPEDVAELNLSRYCFLP
jgi:hypothetical protein